MCQIFVGVQVRPASGKQTEHSGESIEMCGGCLYVTLACLVFSVKSQINKLNSNDAEVWFGQLIARYQFANSQCHASSLAS